MLLGVILFLLYELQECKIYESDILLGIYILSNTTLYFLALCSLAFAKVLAMVLSALFWLIAAFCCGIVSLFVVSLTCGK